jgi:hypothetical protein
VIWRVIRLSGGTVCLYHTRSGTAPDDKGLAMRKVSITNLPKTHLPLRAGLIAFMLAACAGGGPTSVAPDPVLAQEIVNTAPKEIPGQCWAAQTRPAVIETVTEQIEVTPASIAPDGTEIPATYRVKTSQRVIGDREMEYFRTPCEDVFSTYFLETLQRAMAARGLYKAPITGVLDTNTASAIRNWQRPRGIDSATLSMQAAKILGLLRWETQ